MTPLQDLLLPPPRQLHSSGEGFHLGPQLALAATVADTATTSLPASARALLLAACAEHRCELLESPREQGQLQLAVDQRLGSECYRLRIEAVGCSVTAGDAAGLFYGIATLSQWLRLHAARRPGESIAGLRVLDRPAFRHRGVMLDISRNRVPKLNSLFSWIDQLASWKINQLQLYVEHTFAYAGHEQVWKGWSPFAGNDMRQLDAYCAERFIELVPNQNSFGHWHRWLIHSPYRPLAECPQGIEHPFSLRPEPFGLCATDPRSLELLAELYDQLLPNFRSRLFNVGLDETLDLGRGRSAAACAERGKFRVYLDFLRQVHRLAKDRGRRIMFWGDIALEHPELIAELPMDAIALEWGYEADHPFAENGAKLAASGLEHYVCPGTSSWCSLAGRGHNALLNLAAAARHGREQGACGYLVTDWGDHGHLQPMAVSWLGFAAGAAFAWNTQTAGEALTAPWAEHLDLLLFGDRAEHLGGIQRALADLYLTLEARPKNGSPLFHLLCFPQDDLRHPRYRGLCRGDLQRAEQRAVELGDELARAQPAAGEGTVAAAELAWVAKALAVAARIGQARCSLGPAARLEHIARPRRLALAAEVVELTEDFRYLWRQRSRSGGLASSADRLLATHRLLAS